MGNSSRPLPFPLPPCIISIRINPVGWVMKKRKLFCEISPFTYEISLCKERIKRRIRDFKNLTRFAKEKKTEKLPVLLYEHKSLMRRRLGGVKQDLQENKVVNLSLAPPS